MGVYWNTDAFCLGVVLGRLESANKSAGQG
jgi:hypothetical protein